MSFIKCKDKPPPKDKKFLFKYHCGVGIGQWGQCYTNTYNNSEATHYAYILILNPYEIVAGEDPLEWDENKLIEMDVSWKILEEF